MADTNPNETYQVLARRFRPRTMDEVVGQEAILTSLRQALADGQVPHAFLFSGSRGVGKTTMARILARCLNCETGITEAPCGTCAMCTAILADKSGDVIEIDAASNNGVDDIRDLRERVSFVSMGARYKVYILDEVHMLSKGAFNAFLKTLEEPPPGVVFILATTELHKVPDTIRSRCQVMLFQSLAENDIVQRLTTIATDEGLSIPEPVFVEIARAARGGMRDSETMLERVLPVAREKGAEFSLEDFRALTHRTGLDDVADVIGSLVKGEVAPALHFVQSVVATGVDEREVLGEMLEVLRAILLLKVDGPESGLVTFGGELREQLSALAGEVDQVRLDAMIQAGLMGRERIRRMDDRRLVLELSLLRMAEAGRLATLGTLLEQVGSGAPLTAAAPAPAAAPGAAPASAAPVAAGPIGGGGDLKSRLLTLCKQRKGVLTVTLELCAVHPPEGGVVRLTPQTDKKLHLDRLAAKPVQEDVRVMLSEILGEQVRVQIGAGKRVAKKPAAAAPEKPPASRKPPGPSTEKVMDRFDGRIVEMDEPGD